MAAVSPAQSPKTVRFGPFELDLQTGALTRNGRPERLAVQPAQLLVFLVKQRGELVTREELRAELWPQDTFVDFDHGLNNAVNRIREVLGDSASSPRYIQTVPRRGYRFVGELETREQPSAAPADSGPAPAPSPGSSTESIRNRWALLIAVIALLTASSIAAFLSFRQSASTSRDIHSLAVLPFENLSGDPRQEYFADAMTDELTSDLAKIGALRVISRTSLMHYKNTRKTMPEIAKELNVDGIIEGSVLRSGDRVRITAQLINARSDHHLWSESYERDLKDVLTLQNELARTIALQVRAAVTPTEEQSLRPRPVNQAAYEAYLLGRSHLERWTADDSSQALRYFQHAIELDGNFALAYVGVAECYDFGVAGVRYKESLNRALAAATRALELAPDMGEAHAMVGALRMDRDWDFTRAEAEIKQGIALSPNYGSAHHWYAHLLMYLGRFDEALVEANKWMELDPLSPAANLHLGYQYLGTRQWDLAIAQLKKTLVMDPNYVDAHRELGEAYLGKRMYPEAIGELNRAAELVRSRPDYPLYAALLANAKAQAGYASTARKILSEIPRHRPDYAAYIYAGLGDRDKSIALLNEAYRGHSVPLDAKFAVELDPLRSDPRFNELLHKVGLQ